RSSRLKIGKRFSPRIVVEIVVGAELLVGVNPVIEVNCELIAALRFHGLGTEYACSIGRLDWRDELVVQIKRRGVETLRWNLIVRKDIRKQLWGVPCYRLC